MRVIHHVLFGVLTSQKVVPDTQFHVYAQCFVCVRVKCGAMGETGSPKQWRTLGLKDAMRTCPVVCCVCEEYK